MPSFIPDDDDGSDKKRKGSKQETKKPKKQQTTLASFFGKASTKTVATAKKTPPTPVPPPLSEKRKAEVMRIVVGKQRKKNKQPETAVLDLTNEYTSDDDEEQEPPMPTNDTKQNPVSEITKDSLISGSNIDAASLPVGSGDSKIVLDKVVNRDDDDFNDPPNDEDESVADVKKTYQKTEQTMDSASAPDFIETIADNVADAATDKSSHNTSKPTDETNNAKPIPELDSLNEIINIQEAPKDKELEGSLKTKEAISADDDVTMAEASTPVKEPNESSQHSTGKARKSLRSKEPKEKGENTTESGKSPPKPPLSKEDRQKFDKLLETYGPKCESLLGQFRQPPIDPNLPTTDQADVVIANLIDGSYLPLSSLASHVAAKLQELDLTEPNVEDKIKLLATRKQVIKATTEKPVDLFETDNPDWRWEVQIADLVLSKTERTKRKRLANHYHAVQKLLKGIEAHDTKNISDLEEKVLKFEREAEKERLAAGAKRAKDLARERKQKETAEKKEQESAAKQQKKRELEQRKLAKKAAEQQKKQALAKTLAKQESCLKNFLAAPKRAVLHNLAPVGTWNADQFRQELRTGKTSPPFVQLTDRAKRSCQRQTRMVDLKVLQTVESENQFLQEPQYAEQTTVRLKNKFQLFSFCEDVRPAYWGTWSKRSQIVTGRTPFRKDTKFLDYDNDSEAEWEEGDDDMGEELGDNDMEEDEIEEPEMEGENDGWLAADDDDGDKGGEDLILRFVAPSNGAPSMKPSESCLVGFSADEAAELLGKLSVIRLSTEPVCYDIEPPNLILDETETEDAFSDEHMAVFVRFVHNNSMSSREKLIDEFLTMHKTVASSRAQACRVLDSVAEKIKDPLRGTLWKVKPEVRNSLGLQDLGSEDERKRISMLKEMAIFVHHNTAASKDKLIDEVKARFFESKSRAEVLRLIQSMAEKIKVQSTTRWVIKQETRLALDLDLPDEPIDNNASQEFSTNSSTVTPIPSGPRPTSKTKVSSTDALNSSNLLDAFAKKGLK